MNKQVEVKPKQAYIPQLLLDAEANFKKALYDIGKVRGNGGGWKAEAAFKAASRKLYDARVAVGFELTRMEASGMHYIISIPVGFEGH